VRHALKRDGKPTTFFSPRTPSPYKAQTTVCGWYGVSVLRLCRSNTNYLVLVGWSESAARQSAQTAKEIVDQNQKAALGTEKIRVNKDLAHMPAPVFRPLGQRHPLQRDHREKIAAGGIPAQPGHAARRPAFLTMLLVRRAFSCAMGENRVGVVCDPAESMRSCIDAALAL
jgi:hypothetical protein